MLAPLFASVLSLIGKALDDPIVTDRPDFTESSSVVPLGMLQLESGFTFQRIPGGSVLSGPELLIRKSSGPKAEVRLGLPDYNVLGASGARAAGWSDVYVGAKVQIGPLANGDGLALIPAISVPSGNDDFSSGSLDPELKVCWSRELSEVWALSGMLYGLWTTEDGRRTGVLQTTLSFGRKLSEKSGAFFEYVGTFQRARPEHLAHIGMTFQPDSNRQWDIHAGVPVSGPNRLPFLAAGYSVRY